MRPVAWYAFAAQPPEQYSFAPAILTALSGIGVAALKFILHLFIGNTLPDIAHAVFFIPDKLMAGIQLCPKGSLPYIPCRCHSRKFSYRYRGHAPNPAYNDRRSAVCPLFAFQHFLRQRSYCSKRMGLSSSVSAYGSSGAQTTGSMLSSVKPRSAMWNRSFVKSTLLWVKVPRI